MGWVLGLGNGVVFRQGGGSGLGSSYWTHQSEVLFFGLYSEISGGQMPNKVDGGATFLTVAGVAGSETYQCPNTAPYIAADTDYIWFDADGTQRTTTTAELIGYDLQKTPVKYNDTTPNAIVAIMILKAGETIAGTKRDKLFTDMWLPIMWDNSLSAFGRVKDNRGATQQLWTPDVLVWDTFTDTNGVALESHTPEVGGSWIKVANDIDIQNNALHAKNQSVDSLYTIESGYADLEITSEIVLPASSKFACNILFRYLDSTHWYRAIVARNNHVEMQLYYYNTLVVNAGTVALSGTIILKVVTVGNSIKIYANDNEIISTTSNTDLTSTKCGVRIYRDGTYADTPINYIKIKK